MDNADVWRGLGNIAVPRPRPHPHPGMILPMGAVQDMTRRLEAGLWHEPTEPGRHISPARITHGNVTACLHCLLAALLHAGYDLASLSGTRLLAKTGVSRWIAHHPAGCAAGWRRGRVEQAPQWTITPTHVPEPSPTGNQFGHWVVLCQGVRCGAVAEHAQAITAIGHLIRLLRETINVRRNVLLAMDDILGERSPLPQVSQWDTTPEARAFRADDSLSQAGAAIAAIAAGNGADIQEPGDLPALWAERVPLVQDLTSGCLQQAWGEASAGAAFVDRAVSGTPPPRGIRNASTERTSVVRPILIVAPSLRMFGYRNFSLEREAWMGLCADLTFITDAAGPVLLSVRPSRPRPAIRRRLPGLLHGTVLRGVPQRWPTPEQVPLWLTMLETLPKDRLRGADADLALDLASDIAMPPPQ